MRRILILLTAIIIISIPCLSEAATFERIGMLQTGIKPEYGLTFGEFNKDYSNPWGFILYARGLYQLKLSKKHVFYPELRLGWHYLSHEHESNRKVTVYPLHINVLWDWKKLHFENFMGDFIVKPYIGLCINYIAYKSSRKGASGIDSGYQIGANLEYHHALLKNFYIELGVEHFFIAELDARLMGIMFNIGAGYSFFIRKPDTTKEDKDRLLKKYLSELSSGNNEKRIIRAAKWLGKENVKDAVPPLIKLLKHDKRFFTRLYAAVVLGQIRDKRALDALSNAALKDPDDDVRYSALVSISRIGPNKKTMKILKKAKEKEKDPYIRDYIEKMEKLFK